MEERKVQGIKIIAIGGGGFTHDNYPALDDFCLDQGDKARPNLGFVGTASQDDPVKVARFHARFAKVARNHIHLPMTLDAQTLADHLRALDMVYVGGGNTEAMISAWRHNGWDRVLCDAAFNGLMLAGVSAGAVCWFEKFLFSAGSGPMRPVQGLGLITGGACPHYSTETDRQAALHTAIAGWMMPDSIAIDDGVAVAFNASGPTAICAAEPDAAVYHITRNQDGSVDETRIDL